jgi:hyaluronan synthase
MFIGLLELRQSFHDHTRLYLFTIFVLLTWLIWVLKVALSRRYQPWTEPYTTTVTVVIPVVDEPLDLFRDVLTRIVEQRPDQILVVINGPENPDLQSVCEEFAAVEWTWTPVPGKRNAVRVGVERAVGEIVLLVDSDTVWTPDTLPELLKPFADPTVGGVTTRQRILDPRRCFLTRWADWIENSRALYSMPAQSVLGSVGCLPGRTIAFRRCVLEDVMHDFMTQKFLGVFMEVSDDRTLTNLTLKQGYRTVYQSTSLVYTDAPTHMKKFCKQQYRWARGSQYNTLRMLPWMLRHTPVLALFFVIDIVLPFLWFCSAIAWLVRTETSQSTNLYAGILQLHSHTNSLIAVVALTVLTSTLSMCLRQQRHLEEVPTDVLRMPVFVMFSTLVLMPIRMIGFVRLGHQGSWGTRAGAHVAGQDDAFGTAGTVGSAGTAVPLTTGGPRPVPDLGSHDRAPSGDGDTLVLERALPPAPVAPPPARPTRPGLVARLSGLNPRAALPYLLAAVAVTGGVLYDIRPT